MRPVTKFLLAVLAGAIALAWLGERAFAANDFSGDPNCVALWRFEDDSWLDSTTNGNDLTAPYGVPVIDPNEKKEGNASADFGQNQFSQWEPLTRNNNVLSNNFPLKGGTTNNKLSVAFWFREDVANNPLLAKQANGSTLCWHMMVTGNRVRMQISTTGGDRLYVDGDAGITTGQWYHVGATYDRDTGDYQLRVWDDQAGTVQTSTSGNFGGTALLNTYPWWVGRNPYETYDYYDGKLDEIAVFNRILTFAEIDAIRGGTYGSAPAAGNRARVMRLVEN